MKIIANRAKCNVCGDIVESKHRHDFRTCLCGALSVDGGRAYLKRSGDLDKFTEMSELEPVA